MVPLSAASVDTSARRIASTILNEARGFFLDDDRPLDAMQDETVAGLLEKPRWILNPGKPVDQVAATCTEAYLEVCNLLAFPRPANVITPDADILTVLRRCA